MASSDTEIVNLALANLGASRITSLDDATKTARLSKLKYPEARDAVLVEHRWNFALERKQLTQNATGPLWGYEFSYNLPEDPYCLRALEVNGENISTSAWRVEGRKLVTDIDTPLELLYIARVTDVLAYSPMFVTALAAYLAMELAEPISRQDGLTDKMARLYAAKIRKARSVDGLEQTPIDGDDDRDYTWLLARY